MKRVISTVLCIVTLLVSLNFALPATAAATPKLIAITFDDGPSGYTPTLLDGLKARGAKATFFIVGNMASSRMDTVKRAVKEGHQIANHTMSHPELTKLSASGIKTQLNNCRSYLVKAAGEQTFLLRPPYGSYNSTVRNNANAPIILWSVDTLDWKYRNADTVYRNIINNAKDGSIVLLHDLYSTSVQGALRAIDTLKSRGYQFVTVNELFRRRAVPLEKGKVYSAAYNKGITLPEYEPPKPPETPVISFDNILGGKRVKISCATKGATVYYTVDGTTPTKNSKKYTKPFDVSKITPVNAISIKELSSKVASRKIWVEKGPSAQLKCKDNVVTVTPPKGATVMISVDGQKAVTYKSSIKAYKTVKLNVRLAGKADNVTTYTVTGKNAVLTDVKRSDWYYKAVGKALDTGVMKGISDHLFAPKGKVTRAMFVTVLHRLSKNSKTTYKHTTFADVPKDKWYSKSISWAQAEKVAVGVSERAFAPNMPITREQMCSLLARFFEKEGVVLTPKDRPLPVDMDKASPWSYNDVVLLYKCGIVNGVGNGRFEPRATATRAQCAKLITDVYSFIK